MPDPEMRKCAVDGVIRPVGQMIQYSTAPVSKSGTRKYYPIWYCADKNHDLTFLAHMASRQRP